MAEWRRLAALACDAPDVGRTVATRPGGDIDHAQWVAAVRRWRATLAQAAGTEVALYFADAADFAAALYGAWHAGKAVLLPGDAQAATLAQVRAVVDACAGNLPGALEAAAAPSPEPLQALDPSRCRLTVFTSGSGGELGTDDLHACATINGDGLLSVQMLNTTKNAISCKLQIAGRYAEIVMPANSVQTVRVGL